MRRGPSVRRREERGQGEGLETEQGSGDENEEGSYDDEHAANTAAHSLCRNKFLGYFRITWPYGACTVVGLPIMPL